MDEKPNRSLVTLSQDALALEQLLMESGGEIDETVEKWLSEIESNLATKIDSYDFTIKRLEASSDVLRKRADSIRKVALGIETAIDRMKATVLYVMGSLNVTELKGNEFVLQVRRSSNPKLIVEDENQIPNEFKTYSFKVNNDQLKSALKSGDFVDGARLEYTFHVSSKINKEILK